MNERMNGWRFKKRWPPTFQWNVLMLWRELIDERRFTFKMDGRAMAWLLLERLPQEIFVCWLGSRNGRVASLGFDASEQMSSMSMTSTVSTMASSTPKRWSRQLQKHRPLQRRQQQQPNTVAWLDDNYSCGACVRILTLSSRVLIPIFKNKFRFD